MSRVRKSTVLLVVCFALCCSYAAEAADEVKEANAADTFRRAFTGDIDGYEQLGLLRDVVCRYSDTVWGDDALWVLACMADKRGDEKRSVLMLRKLVQRGQSPKLEAFTKTLPVYRSSYVAEVLLVVDRMGYRYRASWRVPPPEFNPLPMAVHQQLARAYHKRGLLEHAAEQYRLALKAAPDDALFTGVFRRQADELREEIRLRDARRDGVANFLAERTEKEQSAQEAPAGETPAEETLVKDSDSEGEPDKAL